MCVSLSLSLSLRTHWERALTQLLLLQMDMRVEETADKFRTDDLLSSSGEVELHAVHRDRKGKGRAY